MLLFVFLLRKVLKMQYCLMVYEFIQNSWNKFSCLLEDMPFYNLSHLLNKLSFTFEIQYLSSENKVQPKLSYLLLSVFLCYLPFTTFTVSSQLIPLYRVIEPSEWPSCGSYSTVLQVMALPEVPGKTDGSTGYELPDIYLKFTEVCSLSYLVIAN